MKRETIEKIEQIVNAIIYIDKNKQDGKITINEFSEIKSNFFILKTLTGIENDDDLLNIDWGKFKDELKKYLEVFGFFWEPGGGQAGTLILKSIRLTEDFGVEVGKYLLQNKSIQIRKKTTDEFKNLFDVILDIIPKLKEFVKIYNNIEIDLSIVRETIKKVSLEDDKEQIKFFQNSFRFYKEKKVINYKEGEIKLGEAIKEKIKQKFEFDEIYLKQLERKEKKYENLDILGLKIKSSIKGDDVEIYSFELKPSNDVSDISSAISQAVNYKKYSNFTYIVIPFFDIQTFYDKDRLQYFYDLCIENELGIVSVNLDLTTDNQKIDDLDIVIKAKKREISDLKWLKFALLGDLEMQKNGESREYCCVCNKIVSIGYKRKEKCGWLINSNENIVYCKKELEEKNNLLLMNFLHKQYPNNIEINTK
jgi:hypothetical protein